ncbi:RepB family protein [Nitrosophilus labii]|uniref:RepB family protein n=1 Tax=Nitrosophilus labii TaxID=2706014 RepID=UPI001656EDD2|nr:RepB family protein [Nitrosophilus labii]
MAAIDNVLKKLCANENTKKVSLTIKISSKLNDDLQYVCNTFGITKSQLIEELLDSSGLSKKAAELRVAQQSKSKQETNTI